MTDDELSRLLDAFQKAAYACERESLSFNIEEQALAYDVLADARAAILSHFDRRKEGEGGEDAERWRMAREMVPYVIENESEGLEGWAFCCQIPLDRIQSADPSDLFEQCIDAERAARTEGKGNG